jgi:hypothetical protein
MIPRWVKRLLRWTSPHKQAPASVRVGTELRAEQVKATHGASATVSGTPAIEYVAAE